jgi:four helix bundle protein
VPVESHKDLLVWQKGMDLAVETYRLTQKFPRTETYGLTAQLTRAVPSVPANIAEGSGRATRRDYGNLSVAKGSLRETETFLLLAKRLGYVATAEAQPTLNLLVGVSKMLTALRKRLLSSSTPYSVSTVT